MEQELVISTKQATEYLLNRSGVAQNRVDAQVKAVKNFYQRHSAQVIQAFSAVAVMVLVGFSGPMVGFTQENANKVLAETGNQETGVNDTATAYVAANVANGLGISVADEVSEHTESLSATSQMLDGDQAYLRKASAVTTDTLSYQDIRTYKVKDGENLSDVAKKFGITSATIRNANDMDSGAGVSAGDKLTILPVDGVLHKVASGDTAESLAEHYDSNAAQIISFNDAEAGGLKEGQKIVIPGGTEPVPQQYNPTNSYFASAFTFNAGYTNGNTTFIGTSNGVSNGDNRHFGGQCTWYVAERKGIYGETWGNANQWASSAQARGIPVGSEPKVGAIAQRNTGWAGHVGVVEEVYSDGRVRVRSMNLGGPWSIHDEVGPASMYSAYIYY